MAATSIYAVELSRDPGLKGTRAPGKCDAAPRHSGAPWLFHVSTIQVKYTSTEYRTTAAGTHQVFIRQRSAPETGSHSSPHFPELDH